MSHGQLLLRSPKAPGLPTRVDVLFTDVRAMELRTTLQTLTIEEGQPSDLSGRPTRPQEATEAGHKFYLLRSGDWVGYIIAGTVHWHEDHGEYGEPSALFRGTA